MAGLHRLASSVTATLLLCLLHSVKQAYCSGSGDRLLLRYRSGWHSRHEALVKRRLLEPLLDAQPGDLPRNRKLLRDRNVVLGCEPVAIDLHAVQLQLWELPTGCDMHDVTTHLAGVPDVAFEKDGVVHAAALARQTPPEAKQQEQRRPDDPDFGRQWMMHELGLPYGLDARTARMLGASLTKGGSGSGPYSSRAGNWSAFDDDDGSNDIAVVSAPSSPSSPSLRKDGPSPAGAAGSAAQQADYEPLVVAIIDSGVELSHPDLQGRLWVNEGEIPGNGIDDDGNGYVDDVHGFNFLAGSPDVHDDYFHGTHLAGVVGAVCDNGEGVCGMEQTVLLMPCKFLDADGSGLISNAVRCLDYSIQMGAVMTLNSYGGYRHDSDALRFAIDAAERAGQLFITAAGNNDGRDMDRTPQYPAASNQSNVVTVAATDVYGQLAEYSNVGAVNVDLAAPGTNIWSTLPGGKYGSRDGTSQAAGVVAGAMALLLSAYRSAGFNVTGRATDLRSILMTAGVKASPALDHMVSTGGILDVASLLAAVPEGLHDVPAGWDPATDPLPYRKPDPLGELYSMSFDDDGDDLMLETRLGETGTGLYFGDAGALANVSVMAFRQLGGSYRTCTSSAASALLGALVKAADKDNEDGSGVMMTPEETPEEAVRRAAEYGVDVTADLLASAVGGSGVGGGRGSSGGVYWRDLPSPFEADGTNVTRVGVTSSGLLLLAGGAEQGEGGDGKGDDDLTLRVYPDGMGVEAEEGLSAEGRDLYHALLSSAAASAVAVPGGAGAAQTSCGSSAGGGGCAMVAAGLYGRYDLRRGGQVTVTVFPDRVSVLYWQVEEEQQQHAAGSGGDSGWEEYAASAAAVAASVSAALEDRSSSGDEGGRQGDTGGSSSSRSSFLVEIFYSGRGGVPPGSMRATFLEVGVQEGLTGMLLGVDEVRDADDAMPDLAQMQCVAPPSLQVQDVPLGHEPPASSSDSSSDQGPPWSLMLLQQHGGAIQFDGGLPSPLRRSLRVANAGAKTLYASVAVEPLGVNVLQSSEWLEPSSSYSQTYADGDVGRGSKPSALVAHTDDADDGDVGDVDNAARLPALAPSSSSPSSYALADFDDLEGSMRVQGSERPPRLLPALHLPLQLKASPHRGSECEGHFLAISTSPEPPSLHPSSSDSSSDSPSGLLYAANDEEDPGHTVVLGFECGRTSLRSAGRVVRGAPGCAAYGTGTWYVDVTAQGVAFWDDSCGELRLPGSFPSSGERYYVFAGAACGEGSCPEGALWKSVQVLSGLDWVRGLAPGAAAGGGGNGKGGGGNATAEQDADLVLVPSEAQASFFSWSSRQYEVENPEEQQGGSGSKEDPGVNLQSSASVPPSLSSLYSTRSAGEASDGLVFAQGVQQQADAVKEEEGSSPPADLSSSVTANLEESRHTFDGGDSTEEEEEGQLLTQQHMTQQQAGEEGGDVSQEEATPSQPLGLGWRRGTAPPALAGLVSSGLARRLEDWKLSLGKEGVLQLLWQGEAGVGAEGMCYAELVIRSNDPLRPVIRLPISC